MKRKLEILDYVYERQSIEDIQTYILTKTQKSLLMIPHQHFYFSILGERTIEKLIERGYISIEEMKAKYEDNVIEKQPTKTKKRH